MALLLFRKKESSILRDRKRDSGVWIFRYSCGKSVQKSEKCVLQWKIPEKRKARREKLLQRIRRVKV